MTKINELIEIKTGYARYVNLVQTFDDPAANRDRMTQYMPVKSHRLAFERLAHALYPRDGRVYLLTGSYGTGKSHLCLMLANYFSLKPGDPEMVAFFDNWARHDEAGADKLRNLRGDGRYLVALGEYGGGDDFDSMVLRAIQRACEREGIADTWLDTEYHEATRQIERWETQTQTGAVFRAFQDEMQQRYPAWTLDALKSDLADYSQEARAIFKEVYRAVVGNDFTYNKDNLIPILADFLNNDAFQTRYKGLAIIADEFGDMLDKGAVSVATFQRFAEMCSRDIAGAQLMFFATAHKPFQAYSGGGLSAVDFRVAADRVAEVPLQSEGLEDIIAAIVMPDKTHPVWEAEVAARAGLFNRFALAAARARLFPHLKGPALRERIIENIYPMHPAATHCAIQLSKEIGSNARSVFTFFSGALSVDEGSYPWFVDHADVVAGDDKLSLYTADLLTTYFESELNPDNTDAREAVRQYIRNHRTSMREAQRQTIAERPDGELDLLVRRILDLMLVYEIADVTNTAEHLAFGLYLESDAERQWLDNRLNKLVNDKILFRASSGVYEFRRSDATDFEALIEKYKSDPTNQPADLAREVAALEPLAEWLPANHYNLPYNEDKRLLRVFVRPGDLGGEFTTNEGETVDFFTHQARRMHTLEVWKDRYEGVALYVICETDEEIRRARRLAEANASPDVLVGIPQQPLPIRDAVMNLRAVLHIQQAEDIDSMSLQDRTRLQQDLIGNERRGYRGEFIKTRAQYLEGKAFTWYTAQGQVFIAGPKTEYDPADDLMRERYPQRNTFSHAYLNQIHVARFGGSRDVALSDAVESLVRLQRPVEIDRTAGANRGEIRFLKQCLADNGALAGDEKHQGAQAPYEVEHDAGAYRERLPALAAMVDQLRALAQGETIPVRALLETYAAAPYGQGPVALSLYLAYVIRTFGDELRLQRQPGAVGWVVVENADFIYDLVLGKYPNAVFERQTISPAAHTFISGVYNLFAGEPGAAGQRHSIGQATGAVRDWWQALPALAGVPGIHAEAADTPSTAPALVNLLAQMNTQNPHSFILESLQAVYGYDTQQALTEQSVADILSRLEADKAAIESGPGRVKAALLEQLTAPFEPSGNLYGDYQAAVEAWYKALDANQQDPFAHWHNNQSKPIVEQLRAITNIETTFFERLPAHAGFGLGRVEDWRRDHSAEYVRLFRDGLAHIEANRIKVQPPVWEVQGEDIRQTARRDGAQVIYRGAAALSAASPAPGVTVYLTNTGDDPRDANVQRQQITGRYTLAIKDSPTVKLVSHAEDGVMGQVLTLSFINDDVKYEVQPVTTHEAPEPEFKFVFPQDRDALVVTIHSLLENAIARGLIDRAALRQVLDELDAMLND
jgi:hypothetical protein